MTVLHPAPSFLTAELTPAYFLNGPKKVSYEFQKLRVGILEKADTALSHDKRHCS